MTDLDAPPEFEIDAETVAPHLGLSTLGFMAELRRGLVYQTTERGVGESRGHYRITFRYRARRCTFAIAPHGEVLSETP
jgi:hypothetical protein